MSKNITIARLNTLVTANAAQFTSELDKASAVAKTRGKSISSAFGGIGNSLAGALSVGALIAFGKSVVDLGGQITDLASVADLSQRGFQAISTLAGDSGVKMEEVAKASETMRQKLQDAKINASDPLNKSLRQLGLTSQGLSGLNTEQKWEVIASALVHAKDQQQAMNIASDIFGSKIGPKLRGTLVEIAGGVENAAGKMGGLIISDEQLKRLDDFGDSMQRLGTFTKVFAVNVMDGRVGFQDLWKSAKEMLGYGDKLKGTDIQASRGMGLKLGGIGERAKLVQTGPTKVDLMREAQAKAYADNDREYRAELARIEERKQRRMSDPEYQLKVRKALDELTKAPAGQTVPQAPTDAYARIGLMSSAAAPNMQPQKETNEHLKKVNATLAQIRDGLAALKAQPTAAFGN